MEQLISFRTVNKTATRHLLINEALHFHWFLCPVWNTSNRSVAYPWYTACDSGCDLFSRGFTLPSIELYLSYYQLFKCFWKDHISVCHGYTIWRGELDAMYFPVIATHVQFFPCSSLVLVRIIALRHSSLNHLSMSPKKSLLCGFIAAALPWNALLM